jgi:hypothetical protein
MNKRDQLMAIINSRGNLRDFAAPSPMVTLEEYFDGNDDKSSIGANLPEHPGLDHFYRILLDIRAKRSVQAVLVRIYGVEDGNWPYTDTVYILTSAKTSQVEKWVASLEPSAVYEDGDPDWNTDWGRIKCKWAPDLKRGNRAVYVFWD